MEGMLSLSPKATPEVPAGGGQSFTVTLLRAQKVHARVVVRNQPPFATLPPQATSRYWKTNLNKLSI